MLIPFLWRQKDWSPVVIDAGTDCNAKNGDYLPSSSNICVEGKKYHLVKPGKQAVKCPSESAQHWGMSCHRNDLETMDGINKLTGGKTTWGGLKKEDLVARYVSMPDGAEHDFNLTPSQCPGSRQSWLGEPNRGSEMARLEQQGRLQCPLYMDGRR